MPWYQSVCPSLCPSVCDGSALAHYISFRCSAFISLDVKTSKVNATGLSSANYMYILHGRHARCGSACRYDCVGFTSCRHIMPCFAVLVLSWLKYATVVYCRLNGDDARLISTYLVSLKPASHCFERYLRQVIAFKSVFTCDCGS